MKLINIGVCIDNEDPKGIGRIRYRPYDQFVSEIEMGVKYEKWDETDPFIAIPFLPITINVIPQVKQSIKILRYDDIKKNQNVEYVAGPFSNPHDNVNEVFLTQHKNTTYGGASVKSLPNINDKKYAKQTKNTQPKKTDYGINGNYGSDVIFTESGLVMRGGKLVDKESKNKTLKDLLRKIPILSKKISKIYLKKFRTTKTIKEVTVTEDTIENSLLKFIIEYDLDNYDEPSILIIKLLKVKSQNDKFNSSNFNTSIQYNNSETELIETKLIEVNNYDDASSELRTLLYEFDENGSTAITNKLSTLNIFPYFFKPTNKFLLTNNTLKDAFFKTIENMKGSNVGSSLVYAKNSPEPTRTIKTVKRNVLETLDENKEQTFGAVISDKIFLLSEESDGVTNKPKINFNEINQYEPNQEDYLSRIEPNTYSLVRGEVLISLLKLMTEMLFNHVHNINDHAIYKQEIEQKLIEYIKNIEKDLINKNIKIN